jgi:cholestenol delta-isomerase
MTHLTRRDRTALGLVIFYMACAFTLELYWLVNHNSLVGRTDLFARAFSFYGRGDRGYYDLVSSFETGLESFHLLFTQPLLICLAVGIWRQSTWRYPLQLAVSSYVCYSTILYFLANHVSGYAAMPRHVLSAFLIFYLANLPWVFGNAWLAWGAARSIASAFRQVEGAA